MITSERYAAAAAFGDFVAEADANAALWKSIYERARVPEDLLERAREIGGSWKLLVLLEDWCGDAVNSVPYLARLAEQVPGLELRVMGRDANLDIMDAHLSPTGGRGIPVVIVLDETMQEVGWWGSRPAKLQAWVDSAEGRALEKEDRYREIRRWYAQDRGRSVVAEVLDVIQAAAPEAIELTATAV